MVISKIQLPNEETGIDLNDARIHIYRSLAGTAAKTSDPYYCARWDVSDPLVTEYADGMVVCIKVPVAGNGSYGTGFQINNLGYKPVVFNVNSAVSTRYSVNSVVWATYNATQTGTLYLNSSSATTVTGCWQVMDYDSNTTAITNLVHNKGTAIVTGGALYRYCLSFTRPDGNVIPFHSVLGSGSTASAATNKTMTTELFDPFGGILYYATNAAVAANATVAMSTMNYAHPTVDLRYSTNCGTTLTASKIVYLVVEKSSEDSPYMRFAAPYYTQTLPTTADNKYYMFLGYAGNTYQIELYPDHPIFYHNGTRICTYSGTDHTANDPRISSVDYDMSTGTGVPNTQASRGYSDLITSEVYSSIMRTIASLFMNNSIVFVNESYENATLGLTNYGSNVPTLQISTDNVTWTNWDYSATTIAPNNKLYVRGQNTSGLSSSASKYSTFTIGGNGKLSCYGNTSALINYTSPDSVSHSNYTFYRLFKNCTKLLNAPALPATGLANYCYAEMFYGCTGLTTAPELPAFMHMNYCYYYMFYGCTGLTSAAKFETVRTSAFSCSYMYANCSSLIYVSELSTLGGTDMAAFDHMFHNCTSLIHAPKISTNNAGNGGFSYMFAGCTSLIAAPECTVRYVGGAGCQCMFMGCTKLTDISKLSLPATQLYFSCYQEMFSGCTSLVIAPDLPATTLEESCYESMFNGCTSLVTAPEISATTLARNCCMEMFYNCTSLAVAPELPATALQHYCYQSMFYGCTSLKTAPELPATILRNGCYQSMFYGCTSLNYIKAMFTTTPGSSYTGNWVQGVAAAGTFVKNSAASWSETGDNGIPTGWTVETASE